MHFCAHFKFKNHMLGPYKETFKNTNCIEKFKHNSLFNQEKTNLTHKQ